MSVGHGGNRDEEIVSHPNRSIGQEPTGNTVRAVGLSYDKTPGPINLAPLSHEPASSVVLIKESPVGGRVSMTQQASGGP